MSQKKESDIVRKKAAGKGSLSGGGKKSKKGQEGEKRVIIIQEGGSALEERGGGYRGNREKGKEPGERGAPSATRIGEKRFPNEPLRRTASSADSPGRG